MELFLNPGLLAGLGLASIPIILHLIMRQKPQRLLFPAMQFLRARQERNTRQLRLRHWLLLALRVLLVCLMAIALARPRMSGGGAALLADQEAPVAAVMIFDTTPRMDYRQQNESRLEVAGEHGRWLLGQLPQESQVAVLDNALGSAVFQADILAAEERIKRLKTTTVPQPLGFVIDQAFELLQTADKPRKELYLLSDLAAATWTPDVLSKLKTLLQKYPDIGLYIINVGAKEPQNFALGEAQLTAQVSSRNSDVRLRCELQREGPTGQRAVALGLLDTKGEWQLRAQQEVTVAAGQSQAFEFPLAGLEVGIHQGELRLQGEDGLALDDKRYFTMEVRPAWKVLIVSDDRLGASFLYEALAPEELRRRQRTRYDCKLVTYEQLSKLNLRGEFAAVCLLDPPPQTAATWTQLREYALSGGGIAIFLGRNARKDPESFSRADAQALLAGPLALEARQLDGTLHLAPDGFDHSLLAKFRPLAGKVPWQFFPVYRYWQLDPIQEGVQRVIPFSNRQGALYDRAVGKGRVLTMTTPISDAPSDPNAWNELVRNWPFVMLADQIVLYLAGSLEGTLNYTVGQPAHVTLPPETPVTSFVVHQPAGDSYALASDPRQPKLVVLRTQQPGNYRLESGGTKGLKFGFSTNLAPNATRLSALPGDDIKKALDPVPFQLANSREEIERSQGKGRIGAELFPLLMALLAILLSAEALVANRFYKEAHTK